MSRSDTDPEAPPSAVAPGSLESPCGEPESELVARLQAGDEAAFEQMVRTHGPRLLAVARRILRAEEDARDCVQEAFLSAHRSIGGFEQRSRLGTWLHRIVTNAALMKLRSRQSRPEEPAAVGAPSYDEHGFRVGPTQTNTATPEELLRRDGARKLVRSAIEQLPDGYRVVLLLRDIEGYDTRETAEQLQTTEGAVKVRLHRARNALREKLQSLFEEDGPDA